MPIELMVQPPWKDDWTDVTIGGEHEEEVANILIGRFLACDYEVLVEDEDGEMVSWEEYNG